MHFYGLQVADAMKIRVIFGKKGNQTMFKIYKAIHFILVRNLNYSIILPEGISLMSLKQIISVI